MLILSSLALVLGTVILILNIYSNRWALKETCPIFVFLLFSFYPIPGIKCPTPFPFEIFIHTLMSSAYAAVKKTIEAQLTPPVCSTFHQEEKGGVCPEVLHSQAGCKHPRLPGTQREGAADGARHAPAALHPHPAARRDPHPVEGWDCHSIVRSLMCRIVFSHEGEGVFVWRRTAPPVSLLCNVLTLSPLERRKLI